VKVLEGLRDPARNLPDLGAREARRRWICVARDRLHRRRLAERAEAGRIFHHADEPPRRATAAAAAADTDAADDAAADAAARLRRGARDGARVLLFTFGKETEPPKDVRMIDSTRGAHLRAREAITAHRSFGWSTVHEARTSSRFLPSDERAAL
jgi:hypothetical protein